MGCLPIATQAEAEAGTANDKAMTPLHTKEAIDALGVAQTILASPSGGGMVGVDGGGTAQDFLNDAIQRRENHLSIRADFGGVGNGVASDLAAFNACIAYLNANGNESPHAGLNFTVDIGAGIWNLRAGSLDPLLVSNVTFQFDPTAEIWIENDELFHLGRIGAPANVFVDNIHFVAPRFVCPLNTATVTAGQACIRVHHGARIFVDRPTFSRIGSLLRTDQAAGSTVVSLTVSNPSGNSMPGFDLISLKNVHGGNGAGLFVNGGGGFMFAPPPNPKIVPQVVTSVTKANPGVVTIADHGLTTGAKVRFFRLAGMTELNGKDYTVTVLDANSFSVSANTTAFGTHIANTGYCSELHFSNGIEAAVVAVEGHWDTVVLQDGLWQHYRNLCRLKSNGSGGAPISFVNLSPKYWDYGGAELLKIDLAGASVTQVKLYDLWHFALEGPVVRVTKSGDGSVVGFDMFDVTVGLAGECLISGTWLIHAMRLNRVNIGALHRTDPDDVTYTLALEGVTNPEISGIRWDVAPSAAYGGGAAADDALVSTIGFYAPNGSNAVTANNNLWRARLGMGGVTYGAALHWVAGNRNAIATTNNLLDAQAITVGANPFTWTNNLGLPAYVKISGGTVSNVELGGGEVPATSLASASGVSLLVGPGQPITVTYSMAPTMVAQPVNL